MTEKRFFTKINKNGTLIIIDKECHKEIIDMTLACEILNRLDLKLKTYNEQLGEQQVTIKNLQEGIDYWKQKYEEGTETFTFPPNCDECDFLGSNGICGYCKFTLNCYDGKEDLMDGEVLQNCPLKPLINENKQLRGMNKQLREINKEIGDDLYNCRVNKNIISKALKLWQNTLAEYDICTIKDFKESFELDAKINKEKDKKIKELEVKVLNLELELMKYE